MSDEQQEEQNQEQGQEQGQDGKAGKAEGVESLPEWAQREIRSLRDEAGNWRTRYREFEKSLGGAKPEDVEGILSGYKTQIAGLERQNLVSKVAFEAGLPTELAELLRGDTEADLKKHAATLAKYANATKHEPESLSGGLDPNSRDTDGEANPEKLAARYGRRNRRSL